MLKEPSVRSSFYITSTDIQEQPEIRNRVIERKISGNEIERCLTPSKETARETFTVSILKSLHKRLIIFLILILFIYTEVEDKYPSGWIVIKVSVNKAHIKIIESVGCQKILNFFRVFTVSESLCSF